MNEITNLEIPAIQIEKLDLSSLESIWNLPVADLLKLEAKLCLNLTWPTREDDPRELSEIPECRLWSLRADALCPWLPLILERSSGQLSRHIAMVVPHSFSKTEGIKFNDDALSLWVSHRLFLLDHWSQMNGYLIRPNLSRMVEVIGYELDQSFWPEDTQ